MVGEGPTIVQVESYGTIDQVRICELSGGLWFFKDSLLVKPRTRKESLGFLNFYFGVLGIRSTLSLVLSPLNVDDFQTV